MPNNVVEKTPVKAVFVRLPVRVYAALVERAQREERSLNQIIVRLLRDAA